MKKKGHKFLFECLNKTKDREWDDMLLESITQLYKHYEEEINPLIQENIKYFISCFEESKAFNMKLIEKIESLMKISPLLSRSLSKTNIVSLIKKLIIKFIKFKDPNIQGFQKKLLSILSLLLDNSDIDHNELFQPIFLTLQKLSEFKDNPMISNYSIDILEELDERNRYLKVGEVEDDDDEFF
jgi:hypothetical protein